jgi:hypothetical protein
MFLSPMEGEHNGETENKVVPIDTAKSFPQREQERQLRAEAEKDPEVKRTKAAFERIKQEATEKMEQVLEEYLTFNQEIKEGKRPAPTELDMKRFERYIRKKYRVQKNPENPPDPPDGPKGA